MNEPSANTPVPPVRFSDPIGAIIDVSGFRVACALLDNVDPNSGDHAYKSVQIGSIVKIPTPTTVAFGFVDSIGFGATASGEVRGTPRAEIKLLGEQQFQNGTKDGAFVRGITVYPELSAAVFATSPSDMTLIYGQPSAASLAVGSLHQFPENTAYLKSEAFFSKHSAIVGTTGSGKSCALALILRSVLTAHPHGHVLLLDPHGEYAPAFPDLAETISPEQLRLPYWLFGFDEIVAVVCSEEPTARNRESLILKDAILFAKRDFLGDAGASVKLTVDSPTPYVIDEVIRHISEDMGRLLKSDTSQPYLRLISAFEGLVRDRRYEFMFKPELVHEDMAHVLGRLLRIPVNGRPITILDISAVPSQITTAVVSLLCRLVFDFAVHGDRSDSIPVMVACDEAHRYIPRDGTPGFEPTRLSIGRIAKEGRKYGVSLCLVTQRPSELSETILSQCSTVIALRITNRDDQAYVRSHLPDGADGLLNMLPTLGQQEAILVGEGAVHPMRIRFRDLKQEHRPRVAPTNFPAAWDVDDKQRNYLLQIVRRWRGW